MLIRYLSDVHLEYRKPADGFGFTGFADRL